MININRIIDVTNGIGIIKYIVASSVSQEIGNMQKWENWNARLSIYSEYSRIDLLQAAVLNSEYIKYMNDAEKRAVGNGMNLIHRLDAQWDRFGLIKSNLPDDPRENVEGWIDDRLDQVHAVFFTRGRENIVWILTGIVTNNVMADIRMCNKSDIIKSSWWKIW